MNLVPQFGFLELMLVAVVALVVVGPKDLPKLMRSAGRMVAKARAMAADFTNAFDQMARETEMEELRAEIDALKNDNVVTKAKRDLDAAMQPIDREIRDEMREIKNDINKPAAPDADETANS